MMVVRIPLPGYLRENILVHAQLQLPPFSVTAPSPPSKLLMAISLECTPLLAEGLCLFLISVQCETATRVVGRLDTRDVLRTGTTPLRLLPCLPTC